MLFAHPIVDDELVRDVLFKTHLHEFSVHGLLHWQNVEGNRLYLAQLERGDPSIVSLFALFHDSQRVNEYEDPEHGARGAFLANSFFNMGRLQISQEQLEVLIFACTYHTSQINHDDITIKCCWDADRLDLTRIGICPDPEMLNTESAKAIATQMEYDEIHHNLPFASKDKQ